MPGGLLKGFFCAGAVRARTGESIPAKQVLVLFFPRVEANH